MVANIALSLQTVTTLIQANQVKELEKMIHKDNTKYKLKAFAPPVEGKIN